MIASVLRVPPWLLLPFLLPLLLTACARGEEAHGVRLTIAASAVGAEGALLERQVARFMRQHPDVRVRVQRTPDDATQRHQLFVQWLNARTGDPDVLQVDVVWTAEFAAAGWILPLHRFGPPTAEFFPAAVAANTWAGELHALPWFVDVGMLYWRTDLLPRAPASMRELLDAAERAGAAATPRYGIVWQGARYEGLVTVFNEYLGATGGRMLTDDGRAAVQEPASVRALALMREQLARGAAPMEVLTWHEEETRFAFQNGDALLMRNWPYAYALLADAAASSVAGRVAVAPMPAADGGAPTATLGGAALAVNRYGEHPDAAYALAAYLTAPEQMLERAAVGGYFPARPALFTEPRLARVLAVPVDQAYAVVLRARPRPVTPVWSQLSELLQIQLHRALAGQVSPEVALRTAAEQMDAAMARTGVRELMARTGRP